MTLNAFILGTRQPETLADKQAVTKADMQTLLSQAGTNINSTYRRLMQLVHSNQFGLTPQQVAGGLSQADLIMLRKQAILIKSLINFLKPGAITDAIPEATITLPENLFPEAE